MEGDIRDLDTCRKATNGCGYVFHHAALGSVPRSIKDPVTTNAVNIDGFLNMLIAAKDENIKRFIYATSSSTYGDSKELPKIENRIGRPLSPYAITKVVNEYFAKVYSELYALETIGLRYFNVFGKRYTPDFCVLYASGLTEYVEVKHTTFLDDAFFEAHALRQHSIYQETRSCLKLFSENEICVPSLDNLRLLNRYRQLDVKHILPLLNLKTKKMKFKSLENAISRLDGASRAHAWGLVAQHYFVFDNSSPITPDTVIQRNF